MTSRRCLLGVVLLLAVSPLACEDDNRDVVFRNQSLSTIRVGFNPDFGAALHTIAPGAFETLVTGVTVPNPRMSWWIFDDVGNVLAIASCQGSGRPADPVNVIWDGTGVDCPDWDEGSGPIV